MADVDVNDPFEEHEYRPDKPTDENIPLTQVGKERSTWEPDSEQETSFGGRAQERENLKWKKVSELHDKLFERLEDIPKVFYRDIFEVRGGCPYYVGKDEPLTRGDGELRNIKQIEKILGVNRLHELGFDSSRDKRKKITARQASVLNKAEEELPSASDVDKADEIEVQEITEIATNSMED